MSFTNLARGGGSPTYLAWLRDMREGRSPTYLSGGGEEWVTYLPTWSGEGGLTVQFGPTPSSLNRMTDVCENIAFPRTTYVAGNNHTLRWSKLANWRPLQYNLPWIAENLEETSSCHRCHQTTSQKRHQTYRICCHGYLLYLMTVLQMMVREHCSLVLLSKRNSQCFTISSIANIIAPRCMLINVRKVSDRWSFKIV